MATTYSCTIKKNGGNLHVRSSPSMSGKIIAKIPNGTKVTASKVQNGWYYIDKYKGWSSGNYIKATANNTSTNTPPKEAVTQTQVQTTSESDQIQSYLMYENPYASTDTSNYITTSLDGIYGIPYQFMSSVDRKLEGTKFGHMYADRIVARMPLLLLSPGRVNFTREFRSRNAAAQALQALIDTATPTDLNTLVNSTGRYYTFDYDYESYYNYVDAMCMSSAYFLGIHDTEIKINGKWTKIKDIKWAKAGNDAFKGIVSKSEYVAFYVDSLSTVNESFSNGTTESQLAGKINSFSDIGRELAFLTGVTTGNNLGFGEEEALQQAMSTVSTISNTYLNGNQLFTDIAKNFATVAVGGKLIFPEIWADSTYSKSYDINIKLRTPDCDKISWFMNICVPLCHLICLTAPRQAATEGPNAYISPFLVRGFYKGLFNCDMGIITDLSITRGKDRAWTLDGLPTEVDVSLTLKDLYSMLTLTGYDTPGAFANNIALVDYIANSCGININEPDLTRMVDIYVMLKGHKLKNVIPDVWLSIQQDIANLQMTTQSKLVGLLGSIDNFLPL